MSDRLIFLNEVKHPATVLTTQFYLDVEYRQECILHGKSVMDQNAYKTNVKAPMSDYRTHHATNLYDPLLVDILDIITKGLHCRVSLDLDCVTDAWFALYNKGDHTVPHNHGHSDLAFCYYLKASEESAPLVFPDVDFKVNPTTGTLAVFPGYLLHEVPEQQTEEERIIFAGNITVPDVPREGEE